MTGTGPVGPDRDELLDAIRYAYHDVRLAVPLADIQQGVRRRWPRFVVPARTRVVLAAAAAVMVVAVGVWVLVGQGVGGGAQTPGHPATSASTAGTGKPPRPTSSASADAGRCADYVEAELGGSSGRAAPPLRLTFALDQTRLLVYATDTLAVTCWLSGDLFTVGGSPTAVNDVAHPPGQLSYSSEDSGHGWGGLAFGRVPAGTTQVTISFPTGPAVQATVVGEWYGYLAPPGPDSDRLTTATKVTAVTPAGYLTRQVRHG
jgi:hypothetical protein